MFSPMVPIISLMVSATVRLAARKFGLGELVEIALGAERRLGNAARHRLKGLVARDEVGLGVDLDEGRLLWRQPRARSGLRRRRGRPSWRPWRGPWPCSQSTAASMSPLVSLSAALQSIMPAPVLSRRSFTMVAVIVMPSSIVPPRVYVAAHGLRPYPLAQPRAGCAACSAGLGLPRIRAPPAIVGPSAVATPGLCHRCAARASCGDRAAGAGRSEALLALKPGLGYRLLGRAEIDADRRLARARCRRSPRARSDRNKA